MYQVISIFVMFIVTYIPRAFPLAFMHKEIHNRFIKSFLFYVPYAVLTALTFPTVFYCTGNIYTGIIGTAVALGLAFFNQKLFVVALGAVLAVFGFSYLF